MDPEDLAATITKLERALERLRRRVRRLEKLLEREDDPLDRKLASLKQVELGILNNRVLRGTLEWVGLDALGIKTDADPPEEVIVFKHAITYIRPREEGRDHTGMYV